MLVDLLGFSEICERRINEWIPVDAECLGILGDNTLTLSRDRVADRARVNKLFCNGSARKAVMKKFIFVLTYIAEHIRST